MKIELSRDEKLHVVCEGRLVAEIILGEVIDAAPYESEVRKGRVAGELMNQLRGVTDWAAFADGVGNVLRHYPQGGIVGYVYPPDDEKNPKPERIKEYETCWHAGQFVRRFISEDRLSLFELEAG